MKKCFLVYFRKRKMTVHIIFLLIFFMKVQQDCEMSFLYEIIRVVFKKRELNVAKRSYRKNYK